MEVALKTVLQFTPEDIARIEKAKKANKHGFNNIVKQIIILFYFSYLHILLLLKKYFLVADENFKDIVLLKNS